MGPYEYICVTRAPKDPKRKTTIFEIRNKRSGDMLGDVKWYGPWRQFCFFPLAGTVWSNGCLYDIKDVIAKAMDDRRRTKKGLAPLDIVDDRRCCGSCVDWDTLNRTDGVGECEGEEALETDVCKFWKPKGGTR